jgi:hypothetical protein
MIITATEPSAFASSNVSWSQAMLDGVARVEFVRIGVGIAQVVAGSLDVERHVGQAAELPTSVLDARHVRARLVDAERVGLHLLPELVLAERERRRKEHLPFVIESLARVEAAVRRPIAVGPVVVAGGEDRGRLQVVEEALRLHVERVAAGGRCGRAGGPVSALEVAVVHGEGEMTVVHVGDQVRHAGQRLSVGVGQVSPEPDRVSAAVLLLVVVFAIPTFACRHSRRYGCDEHRGDGWHHQFP